MTLQMPFLTTDLMPSMTPDLMPFLIKDRWIDPEERSWTGKDFHRIGHIQGTPPPRGAATEGRPYS